MANITAKGLKPIIIKYVAMLMGICYVLSPLQKPISWLLHEISHGIETPTHLISHESILNLGHKSLNHYDGSSYALQHEHVMVDLVTTIFETSNEENNQKDSLLKEVKIDKHLTVIQFKLQNSFNISTTSTFWKFQKKIRYGYLENIEKPPQLLLG